MVSRPTESKRSISGPAHPEIRPGTQVRDYNFFDKLEILSTNPVVGFLPTTPDEVNHAFQLVFNTTKGKTSIQYIGNILSHQADVAEKHKKAGKADEVDIVAATETSFIARFSAYAMQAQRDMAKLVLFRNEMAGQAEGADPQTTLAHLAKHTPVHSGPGQLVRYLDLLKVTEDGTADTFDFNPFGGDVRDSVRGGKAVIDPYTASERPHDPLVAVHIGEVLERISAFEADGYIANAFFDQQARSNFWSAHLTDLGRTAAGSPIMAETPVMPPIRSAS